MNPCNRHSPGYSAWNGLKRPMKINMINELKSKELNTFFKSADPANLTMTEYVLNHLKHTNLIKIKNMKEAEMRLMVLFPSKLNRSKVAKT